MTRRWITLLALVGALLVGGATQATATPTPDLTTADRPLVCLGLRTPIDLGQCVTDPLPDLKDALKLP
jgi:hypothetical protein